MTAATGAAFRLGDYVGRAVLLTAHAIEEVATDRGMRAPVRCDVVILDGDAGPQAYPSELIFDADIVRQLVHVLGRPTVAVVGLRVREAGPGIVTLREAPAEAIAAAERYLEAS